MGGLRRVGVSLPFPEFGALPSALSSGLQRPAAPITTSVHTPTTLAALNVALATPGAHVTLGAGMVDTVGTIVIDASDVVLEMTVERPNMALEIARDRERIRVQGGALQRVHFRFPGAFDPEVGGPVAAEGLLTTDVSLVDVTALSVDNTACLIYGRRVALSGCSFRGQQYGVYVAPASATIYNEDITMRDCAIVGDGQASLRLFRTTRHVVVESTLGGPTSTRHGWRIHEGTSLAYCARNVLNPGGIMLSDPAEPTDVGLGEFWFEDNEVIYTLTNGVIITIDPYTRFTQGSIRRNTFTIDPATATTFADIWNYGAVPGNWDLSGNVVLAP